MSQQQGATVPDGHLFRCSSVAIVPGRQRLRSAGCNYLVVPRHRLAMYRRRSFVIAGPSAWNDLPDELRDISLSRTVFRSRLKTYFSPTTSAPSALGVFHYNALYKFMFTIYHYHYQIRGAILLPLVMYILSYH